MSDSSQPVCGSWHARHASPSNSRSSGAGRPSPPPSREGGMGIHSAFGGNLIRPCRGRLFPVSVELPLDYRHLTVIITVSDKGRAAMTNQPFQRNTRQREVILGGTPQVAHPSHGGRIVRTRAAANAAKSALALSTETSTCLARMGMIHKLEMAGAETRFDGDRATARPRALRRLRAGGRRARAARGISPEDRGGTSAAMQFWAIAWSLSAFARKCKRTVTNFDYSFSRKT